MIQTFVLNNHHQRQWLVSKQPFSYLYLLRFQHESANNDFSHFSFVWHIPQTSYTISQYINFYIKKKPHANGHQKMNLISMLPQDYKNLGDLCKLELRLGKRFESERSALIITLDIPD
jgi:hypothetical protein